jgi:RNA polymerase sigma-70 factor (ECF subfamily)
MTALVTGITLKPRTSTILRRIAERDKTAVEDCIDTYGNFIWALARKFTRSLEEAEAATDEIFIDIWRHSERGRDTQAIEKKLIAMIALRRLVKSSQQADQTSLPAGDAASQHETRSDGNSKYV